MTDKLLGEKEYLLRDLTALLMDMAYLDGEYVIHKRAQVLETNRCKAYIRSNEPHHHKPHFHVECRGRGDCVFDFSGGILAGEIDKRDKRIVLDWLKTPSGSEKLASTWNEIHGQKEFRKH